MFKLCNKTSHLSMQVRTLFIPTTDVLSKDNKEKCLKNLKSLKHTKTKFKSSTRAAVLVPLCLVDDHVSLLFTIRSPKLNRNRGQVSFPGGMEDRLKDKCLVATALRETEEEIGVHPKNVDVWGPVPVIQRPDIHITPILGVVENLSLSSHTLNSDEVSSIFTLPLTHLCDKNYFKTTSFRMDNKIQTLPVYLNEYKRIWGLTAVITHIVLSALIPNYYKNKLEVLPMINKKLPSMKK